MRCVWVILLLTLAVFSGEDPAKIRECQAALQKGGVPRGKYPDGVLIAAVKSKPVFASDLKSRDAILKLFKQIADDSFKVRRKATNELKGNYYDPTYLKQLLEGQRDPEILERSRSILAHWKANAPKEDSEKGVAEMKLKMWYNLPPGLAKLKSFPGVRDITAKYKLGYQNLHDCLSSALDGVPAEERIEGLIYCLAVRNIKDKIPCVGFVKGLTRKDWHNSKLQDALMNAIGDSRTGISDYDLETVLKYMPKDLDISRHAGLLKTAGERRYPVAVVLTRQGVRKALPVFLEALNAESYKIDVSKDSINGGSGNTFSLYYDFDELKQGGFEKFAPEIVASIEKKFIGREPAVQTAYMTVLEELRHTPAAQKKLAELTRSKTPQTAIHACCLLLQKDASHVPALVKAMEADARFGIDNNFYRLKEAVRLIRRDVLIKKDAALRKQLLKIVSLMLAAVKKEKLAYHTNDLFQFICSDLFDFGIWPDVRSAAVASLTDGKGSYPASGFQLLAMDLKHRGDTDEFLKKLREELATGGSKKMALYAGIRLELGDEPEICVAPFRKELKALIKKDECPQKLRRIAWMVDPIMVIRQCKWKHLKYLFNELTINPGVPWFDEFAKLYPTKANESRAALFRLSWDLPGANLDKFLVKDVNPDLTTFAYMDWQHPPRPEKLVDRVEKLFTDPFSNRRYLDMEIFKQVPSMLLQFDLENALKARTSSEMLVLRSLMAYQRGNEKEYKQLVALWRANAGGTANYQTLDRVDRQKDFLARKGLAAPLLVKSCAHRHGYDYRYIQLMAENGHLKEVMPLQERMLEAPDPTRWELPYCHLLWAWNAIRLDRYDMAEKHVWMSLGYTAEKQEFQYGRFLLRLIKKQSPELKAYANILNLRRKPVEYEEALAAFAEQAKDSDLKALSAYQAGRQADARGSLEVARKHYLLGAEAKGMHSPACEAAIKSAPKPQFTVTGSWHSRKPLPTKVDPFTFGIGLCYQGLKPSLKTNRVTWYDPYGIPASVQSGRYYHGSGWWLYLRETVRRWLYGQWSVAVWHAEGVEHHQRTLKKW